MRRKLSHKNYKSWDVGVIEVRVRGETREAVVVIEHDERRFFPVPRALSHDEIVLHALENRFAAVGWWGIPRRLRLQDPNLVDVIRRSELLDDTELLVVDGLMSLQWARRAAEKILRGERDSEREYLLAS